MKIEFIHCHGSGNDFFMIDGLSTPYPFEENDYVKFTQLICNRKGMGGADGSLFLLPSKTADARMRIFNSDGSEPEMCGNGIRCIARKAYDILQKEEFSIETKEANLRCKKEEDIYPGIPSFSVEISNVAFQSKDFSFIKNQAFIEEEIPLLSDSCKFSAVDLGNPHLLVQSMQIEDSSLQEIGEKSNNSPHILPNGVNTSFFKKLGKQSIFVRTFERGVGLTNSCGTAMSAASIISCLTNTCNYDEWISVYNEGGMVKCKVNSENNYVTLLGNASYLNSGTLTYSEQKISKLEINEKFDLEHTTYHRFLKEIKTRS